MGPPDRIEIPFDKDEELEILRVLAKELFAQFFVEYAKFTQRLFNLYFSEEIVRNFCNAINILWEELKLPDDLKKEVIKTYILRFIIEKELSIKLLHEFLQKIKVEASEKES